MPRFLPLFLLAGLTLAAPVVVAAGAVPAEAPLTLEQAASLALRQGPQRQDLEFSSTRAAAGADLADSAFRWHVGLGTAKIPQIAELAAQFGGALGDVRTQLQNLASHSDQPVQPTVVSPGLTGIVYDPLSGHRWAVLPALTAARSFPNGGQLVLTTHWAGFGPLSDDSATRSYTAKWQPFDRLPLAQYTQPLFKDPSTLEAVARRDEAGRNLDRDRAGAALTETKTLLDLAQAYFAVAQAEDEVAVAGRALAQAQTEARVRQDKAWQEEATGLDLLEADLLTQKAAARVEMGRRALDLARQRLNRLLGRPLTAPVVLAPPAAPPAEPAATLDLAAAVREALDRRPEVALA
ncbi:MAG: TolC family protein, partial [Methanocella sp.]